VVDSGESGTTKVDHGGDLAKRFFQSRGRTSTATMNPAPCEIPLEEHVAESGG
jgi:hypothetical protein